VVCSIDALVESTLSSPRSAWTPEMVFDDFELIRPLGRGGMGQVWLARDRELHRNVAIKLILEENPSRQLRDRFLREARALARLSHPNVVPVYRIGKTGNTRYIAYEFIAGQSLDRLPRPVHWTAVLALGIGLARGLDAAHSMGILHRDIKPSNAVLSERGEVKLIDFGLAKLIEGDSNHPVVAEGRPTPVERPAAADPPPSPHESHGDDGESGSEPPPAPASSRVPKGRHPSPIASTMPAVGISQVGGQALTQPGKLLGTPAYMAPELWQEAAASVRSDLFALGMLLFELVVGELPHDKAPWPDMGITLTTRDMPPLSTRRPEVPLPLATIIDRCLRRDPARRPASAAEVQEALEEAQMAFVPGAKSGVRELQLKPDRVAVGASFARIRSRMNAFTVAFYERLFALAPGLRKLFPDDLGPQRDKLAQSLELAVSALPDATRFATLLEDLGERHRDLGIAEEHFAPFERALLETTGAFDEEFFDDDLAAAWQRTFVLMREAMLRGMRRSKGARSERPATPTSTPPSPDWPMTPRTRYAVRNDVSLAYQVFGEGPIDLLLLPGWISHIEIAWQHSCYASFLRRLGEIARVVLLDHRGTGLSDRGNELASMEDHVEDVVTVLDAAGVDRSVVVGFFGAAAQAALVASLHPERTRALVIHGGAARMVASSDYPWGQSSERYQQLTRDARQRWGEPVVLESDAAPSMAGNADFSAWLGRYLRTASSPGAALGSLRNWAEMDIRPFLPGIGTPTLVLHRSGDRFMPVGGGRHLAASIPGASMVVLPGDDHLPFVGDVERWLEELRAFLSQARHARSEAHPLRSIVAVDVSEDSELGDALPGVAREHAMDSVDGGGTQAWWCRGGECALRFSRAVLSLAAMQRVSLGLGITAAPSIDGDAKQALDKAIELARRAPTGGGLVTDVVRQLVMGRVPLAPTSRSGEHLLAVVGLSAWTRA
jgi:serine/threonine protein kinase/pimeloyl-ACP methyl ester carboxylesterase